MTHKTYQKQKPFQSKAFTNKSKGNTCINCGAPDAYAAHYNGIWQHAFGKGRGIKCNDLATADFCKKCDDQHSEGVNIYSSNEERDQMWFKFIMLTNFRRLDNGVLKT